MGFAEDLKAAVSRDALQANLLWCVGDLGNREGGGGVQIDGKYGCSLSRPLEIWIEKKTRKYPVAHDMAATTVVGSNVCSNNRSCAFC